jgi:hypothetical protein
VVENKQTDDPTILARTVYLAFDLRDHTDMQRFKLPDYSFTRDGITIVVALSQTHPGECEKSRGGQKSPDETLQQDRNAP